MEESSLEIGTEPEEWTPPEEFEDYELVRVLGRGEAGDVYLALDTVLARHVAVKFIAAVHPDLASRQRFLIEARAAARVQHPNVAVIYRVGELDDHPYIVSEFVRGQPLDQLPKPVPWRRSLEIGEALARGLAAAHRNGVLHCDIKPANTILGDDGIVKLFDFGLATLMDQPRSEVIGGARRVVPGADGSATTVAGTPDYMAPEVWRGEGASRRADVYSLGALLFELCAGKPPFGDVSPVQLPRVVQEREAPLLEEVAPGVDPRFAAIINRSLRRDAEERYGSGDELREALERLARTATSVDVPVGNPYRGLRPFEAEHRALFFGRSAEVGVLLDRLRAEPFVLVTGESGVGKSSICRAGVLPAVAEGALAGGRTWSSATVVPGRRPVAALAAVLAEATGLTEEELETWLGSEQGIVVRALRKHLGDGKGLLLFIDQLEEITTQSDPDESAAFEGFLARVAAGVPGLRLLGSLRADFLTRAASLRDLGEEISRALYILRPLTPERMREVIVGPAQVTGVRFESDQLVAELVESTVHAKGALPLLQFALAELWEARDAERNIITAEALAGIGGVAGALARHADEVVDALPPAQTAATRSILKRLVNLEGTRTRRGEAELVAGQPAAAQALNALVRGRLLVVHEGDDGTVFEIAHEVLIEGWGTLRRWLHEDLEGRIVRERIAQAATEWKRLGRAADALWSARQLAESDRLDLDGLNQDELEFLGRSRSAVRRARLRRWAFVAAVPVLVAGVYAAVELKARYDLRERVNVYLVAAQKVLVEARGADRVAMRLRVEAFQLFDAGKEALAEKLWERTLAKDREAETNFVRAGQSLEAALAVDQTRSDVRGLFADLLLERALLEERVRDPESDELIQRLALYDTDGSRRRRWNAPATLTIASTPGGATVTLIRTTQRSGSRQREVSPRRLGTTPLETIRLPPGSYLLVLEAAGRKTVRYPIRLQRNTGRKLKIYLPRPSQVPSGFVYIPPGRFFYGSTAAEEYRRGFYDAVPSHETTTDGYLIGRHEVTNAEWIRYLGRLPAAERVRRTPAISSRLGQGGSVRLTPVSGQRWVYTFGYASYLYTAPMGSPIRYASRRIRATQDWLKFPVTGISAEDAEAYLAWLRSSGRVPGARLCTEFEWERAARGADDRQFPHGNTLKPTEANFDKTYGRDPGGFGPDEVGSHPESRSPFGIEDMAGNAFEWTTSAQVAGRHVIRGGSYFHDVRTAQSANRASVVSTLRDATLGMRVCASFPPG